MGDRVLCFLPPHQPCAGAKGFGWKNEKYIRHFLNYKNKSG